MVALDDDGLEEERNCTVVARSRADEYEYVGMTVTVLTVFGGGD